MKNTATRFNAAMEATKDAIKSPSNDQVVE
jgi:hypothetical protein